MSKATRMHNPAHPGEVLRNTVLGDNGLSVREFARRLRVSHGALSRVVNAKAPVRADMALRLSDALGGSADSWLRMQNAHDLWRALQKPRPKVNRIKLPGESL